MATAASPVVQRLPATKAGTTQQRKSIEPSTRGTERLANSTGQAAKLRGAATRVEAPPSAVAPAPSPTPQLVAPAKESTWMGGPSTSATERAEAGMLEGRARSFVGGLADRVPGYRLMTVVLGRDPIRDRAVPSGIRAVLRAAAEFFPKGTEVLADLEKSARLHRVEAGLADDAARLGISGSAIGAAAEKAWLDMSTEPLLGMATRIIEFAGDTGRLVLAEGKSLAREKLGPQVTADPRYHLLTFALEYDPVADHKVERTAEGLVEGVLGFFDDGKTIFQEMKANQVIPKAKAWFEAEVAAVGLTWERIQAGLAGLWNSLGWQDLFNLVGLVHKVVAHLGESLAKIGALAGRGLAKLGELLFQVIAEKAGPIGRKLFDIIRRAEGTLHLIWENPTAFVANLVKAAAQGFTSFGKNILEHLQKGLLAWLFSSLAQAGIALPEKWTLASIGGLALDILGISYEKIKGKLVVAIGEDRVALLEQGLDLVAELMEGPAALLEKLQEQIGNLPALVFAKIRDWVAGSVVASALLKLASALNPVGGILQMVLAIHQGIQTVKDKITAFLDVLDGFVGSVENIVTGKLGDAAQKVEGILSNAIPLALDFLARLLGLGDVGARIQKTIESLQDRVDAGLTKLVTWLVEKGKSLWENLGGGAKKHGPTQVEFKEGSTDHEMWVDQTGSAPRVMVASEVPSALEKFVEEAEGKKGAKLEKALKDKLKALEELIEKVDLHPAGLKAAEKTVAKASKTKASPKVAAAARATPVQFKKILEAESEIAKILQDFFKGTTAKKGSAERYTFEGLTGTYADMVRQTDDKMTPDHQPQASLLKYVADLPEFKGSNAASIAEGHAQGGWTINIHHSRHVPGRTYGVGVKKLDSRPAEKIMNARRDSKKPHEKRKSVLAVVKDELKADVAAMQAVIASDSNYLDIDAVTDPELSKADKDKLKKDVRKRLWEGEQKLLNQPIDDLGKP